MDIFVNNTLPQVYFYTEAAVNFAQKKTLFVYLLFQKYSYVKLCYYQKEKLFPSHHRPNTNANKAFCLANLEAIKMIIFEIIKACRPEGGRATWTSLQFQLQSLPPPFQVTL